MEAGTAGEAAAHVCVCVCTYKRPSLLEVLLGKLETQRTKGLFSYSVVVVDNDRDASARDVVTAFAGRAGMKVEYDVEPEQNIALARNRAARKSAGDYVAFFDDDQFPAEDWLVTLFGALQTYRADGVLGPVKPCYAENPPQWLVMGGFHERPTYPTGFIIDWRKGRTGNVLLRRDLLAALPEPFDPRFGSGGEDQDFFRRMIGMGHRFVWCNEAVGYEHVPPARWKRSFLLRRALLRGKVSLSHPDMGARSVLASLVAIPVYAAMLPVLLLAGHHLFMRYLVKTCDHLGRVLAAAGIGVIGQKYIIE